MILVIKQVNIEGLGLFSIFFNKKGVRVKIVSMEESQELPPLKNYRGLIVLGGPMNVYETEEYPFLLKEEACLKKALERQIPILGICLGAQLLAKVLGAGVVKATQQELGWYELFLTDAANDDPLFRGLDGKLKVFQWHKDTFKLPKDGVLLAEGGICQNQAFRVGRKAWGLQFHPEMNKKQITDWHHFYKPKISLNQLLNSYFYCQRDYVEQAELICNNFVSLLK